MGENVEGNLYYVEKILRLEQSDASLDLPKGTIVAVIKWENYGYNQTTKQPIQNLKLNPNLRLDIEKMETAFKTRKQAKKMEHQTEKEVANLQSNIFFPAKVQQEKLKTSQTIKVQSSDPPQENSKKKLVEQQMILCKVEAEKQIKKKIEYGIGPLTTQDYFKLYELKQDAFSECKKRKSRKSVCFEQIVDQIKGIYHDEDSYRLVVQIGEKVKTCRIQELMQKCPIHLYNFLHRLLEYMKEAMKEEIDKKESIIRLRQHKLRSISMADRTLQITQKLDLENNRVYFGVDSNDVEKNIKFQKQYFEGKVQYESEEKREGSSSKDTNRKGKKKNKAKAQTLEKDINLLCESIFKDIKQHKFERSLGHPIKPSSKKAISVSSASKSKKSKNSSKKKTPEKQLSKGSKKKSAKGASSTKEKDEVKEEYEIYSFSEKQNNEVKEEDEESQVYSFTGTKKGKEKSQNRSFPSDRELRLKRRPSAASGESGQNSESTIRRSQRLLQNPQKKYRCAKKE